MTAFNDSFRAEVTRIVRKEFKDELSGLRKGNATLRAEIANMKKAGKALSGQVQNLEKRMESMMKSLSSAQPEGSKSSSDRRNTKFDHEALLAKRHALGFTQVDMALLIGVSNISLYKWESGSVVPRNAQLARVSEVMRLGVRAAKAQLAAAKQEASSPRTTE